MEIDKIRDIMKTPAKYGIPGWFFNRQKDSETGKDLHLTGSDLALQTKSDIDDMKKVKSWKGFRHAHGLKVRGQRTRTTTRKGKAIGVKKRRIRRER
jgi:small subunit ribosomal protein S13